MQCADRSGPAQAQRSGFPRPRTPSAPCPPPRQCASTRLAPAGRPAEGPRARSWRSWASPPPSYLRRWGLAPAPSTLQRDIDPGRRQVADLEARLAMQDAVMTVAMDPGTRRPLPSTPRLSLPRRPPRSCSCPGLAPGTWSPTTSPPRHPVTCYQLWYADAAGVHPLQTVTFDGNGPFVAPLERRPRRQPRGDDHAREVRAAPPGEPGPQVVFGELWPDPRSGPDGDTEGPEHQEQHRQRRQPPTRTARVPAARTRGPSCPAWSPPACHIERMVGTCAGANRTPIHTPVTSPPMCAQLSIVPPIAKPKDQVQDHQRHELARGTRATAGPGRAGGRTGPRSGDRTGRRSRRMHRPRRARR